MGTPSVILPWSALADHCASLRFFRLLIQTHMRFYGTDGCTMLLHFPHSENACRPADTLLKVRCTLFLSLSLSLSLSNICIYCAFAEVPDPTLSHTPPSTHTRDLLHWLVLITTPAALPRVFSLLRRTLGSCLTRHLHDLARSSPVSATQPMAYSSMPV